MLKIVHLNTYDGNGGAGKACLRLNKALKDQGIESRIIVHYKFGQDQEIQSFSKGVFNRVLTAFLIILERLLARFWLKPVKVPFSFTWFGRSVIQHQDLKSADIIHLHWINHSFLSPKHLEELRKLNKPIVWTFHDSNAFTGGCHVRFSCDHFINQCGNCPVLKQPSLNDMSNRIWHQKSAAYNQLKFVIISPSKWMEHSVLCSGLMKDREVTVIPNTLSTSIFKPSIDNSLRKRLGIDQNKMVLLSGFMPSRKDSHKGTTYLIESLELLAKRKDISADQIELVIFGNRSNAVVPELPFRTHMLGTISNDAELALIYAGANAFLIPSLDDNLPYTVMESLSCGTPVIAFHTGGIPDMVHHLKNGYLAKYQSAESFADGMEWLIKHENREDLCLNARDGVMKQFKESFIARKHVELYQRLIINDNE
jgi:glycosyltransferase involved in cell wall biosynthesis